MNQSYVTIQGRVGNDVEMRDGGGAPVASFRVASTPRYQREGEWVDGPTSWFTVTCWRGLAANVVESVHRGDPVVVHGRLRVETWQRQDGSTGTSATVEATTVGHDLCRGTARFSRPARPATDVITRSEQGGPVTGEAVGSAA